MVRIIGRKILGEQDLYTIKAHSSSDGFWSENIQIVGVGILDLSNESNTNF